MSKDPEFVILKPGSYLPESEWKKVLGAAVRAYPSPLRDSVPKNPLLYDKNGLIQFPFEDAILFQQTSNSNARELSMEGLGKFRWNKNVQSGIDLSGKVIYVKRLKQHGQFWREINRSEDFRQTVTQWLSEKTITGRSKNQVCLVVGLLMMQDVVVAETDQEAEERELRGEVPLGTVAQIAAASQGFVAPTNGVGDAAAGRSHSKLAKTYFAASTKGKFVFALELRLIKLKRGELQLKDDGPKSTRKLGAENVESGQLLLEDVAGEDWEALLQLQDGE